MQKISAWMFIIIALVMLLPMLGVNALSPLEGWIMVVAYLLVGIMELKK